MLLISPPAPMDTLDIHCIIHTMDTYVSIGYIRISVVIFLKHNFYLNHRIFQSWMGSELYILSQLLSLQMRKGEEICLGLTEGHRRVNVRTSETWFIVSSIALFSYPFAKISSKTFRWDGLSSSISHTEILVLNICPIFLSPSWSAVVCIHWQSYLGPKLLGLKV